MKVLLVEDNPAFAEQVREVLLEVPGETFEITSAGDLSSASALLAAEEIGAVLLDLGLPDSQGIETVRTVRAAYPGVPIVVLTGLDDEETGLRALHEGAQDYLTKDSLAGPSLARSI
ncbi:MAG: response regulator, partial [Methanospirillum sp.]